MEWECIDDDTFRLKIKEGYIYRYHNVGLIFVPKLNEVTGQIPPTA
jgi:hypothetical protein